MSRIIFSFSTATLMIRMCNTLRVEKIGGVTRSTAAPPRHDQSLATVCETRPPDPRLRFRKKGFDPKIALFRIRFGRSDATKPCDK
jgi:hypothetical protein